jgi:hypothetical protein
MVVVAEVNSPKDFKSFIDSLEVRGAVHVVKPNWGSAHEFTSAETLEWLFSALRGRTKVIEGYSAWRNELNTGGEPSNYITPENARAEWRWIKEQDEWFLKHGGFDRIFSKFGVEYINITEEVWSTRTLDPLEVRDLVDSKYGVLVNEEMYGFVPTRVYELKDSTLISLNSSRQTSRGVSLSTRNLFGLIPDPARYKKWHGRNDSRLSQSITDINKIYRSLFSPSYWINEIVGRGIFVGGRNSAEADAVTAELIGVGPGEIQYLNQAANVFGGYDRESVTRVVSSFLHHR